MFPLSRLLPLLALLALFVLPFAVPFAVPFALSAVGGASWAAPAAGEWKGLVPACGTRSAPAPAEGGGTTVTYTPCSTCDLAQLVKSVLDFVWKYVALTGVALMLMIGGFQMVVGGLGGSATGYQKGLGTIKNAFLGLAIVFFAWLAIDTVIKFLAKQSLTGGTPAILFKDERMPLVPVSDIPSTDSPISSTETLYGPWNQIKCTKLDPIPVTTKPPPQTAAGQTVTQAFGAGCACQTAPAAVAYAASEFGMGACEGVQTCHPLIRENLENAARNPEGSALNVPVGGDICIGNRLTGFAGPIQETVTRYNLDPEYFQAFLMTESRGDPRAVSPRYAYGIGQLLVPTARGIPEFRSQLAGMTDQDVANWLLVGDNGVKAAGAYLRGCLNRFGGNRRRAEACYNGGPGANMPSIHCNGQTTGVMRWECPYDSFGPNGATCWGGDGTQCRRNTGFQETRNYGAIVDRFEREIEQGACKPMAPTTPL
ncbi:MAG: lytic transglycosylase domain-containing protein [Patescibacteria group bacterium]|mgnify:CR=1 FL=1